MANEALIAYQNAEKQKNLDMIAALENQVIDKGNIIVQMNARIVEYEAEKINLLQQITNIEADNILIDEIITILSA